MSTFASLTRSQLQAAAKERGIKAGGTNAEIRARLEAAEGDTAGTSTPTTATDADSTANAITNDVDAAADAETTSSQPAAKKAKVESAGSAPAAAAASSSSAADADTAAADDTVVDVDLTGKKFIVMGGFTCGRFRIESTIANLGGEVAKNVVKSLNYIVCGVAERTEYGGVSGPGSKKFKEAKKLKIPVLDEAAFEQLVAAHEATQKRIKGSIQDALIPDLANLVDQFAGGGVAGEGAGAKWAEICDILRITDNVPATEEEITAAEEKLKLAFPLELKQLWRVARNQGMSDGGGSLLHEPHPAYFFPSIEEVLKTYSGENNDFKQYAPALFKELRFLALTNYYQAGDRLECIDLAQKFVVTLDFDHEGAYAGSRGSAAHRGNTRVGMNCLSLTQGSRCGCECLSPLISLRFRSLAQCQEPVRAHRHVPLRCPLSVERIPGIQAGRC